MIDNKKLKEYLNEIWNVLTLYKLLSWQRLLILLSFFPMMAIFFDILMYKQPFTSSNSSNLMSTLIIVPAYYLTFGLATFARVRLRKNLDLVKLKIRINKPFDKFKDFFFKKEYAIKLNYHLFIIYLIFYFLVDYWLFNRVGSIFIESITIPIFVMLSFVILIKIILLYKIIDCISLTNWDRTNFGTLIIGFALTDLVGLLINFMFNTSFIKDLNFSSKILEFLLNYGVVSIPIIPFFISLIYQSKSSFVDDYKKGSLLGNFFAFIILPFLFWFLHLVTYFERLGKPIVSNFRFSTLQQIFIIKELLIITLIFAVFLLFIVNFFWINSIWSLDTIKLPLRRFSGKFVGHSSYTYSYSFFGMKKLDKTLNFVSIESQGKTEHVSKIKSGTAIYPLGFDLIYGDEIEILGYEIKNFNLNKDSQEGVTHLVALYVKNISDSPLRQIIGQKKKP